MEVNTPMTPEMELEEVTSLADDDYIRTLSKDSGKIKWPVIKGLIKDELGGFTIQGGRVSIVPVANKPTMAHVDFPKPFQGQPYVIVTPVTSVPGTNVLGVGATNNTKNGFDAYVTRTNTTETILAWIAIGA
nr:MAG TPA_asm: putative tail fiber protein [Caudoviricetes sp.]